MNPKSDRLFRTASCLVLLALAGRGELAGRQRSFGPLASEEGAPLQRLS